MRQNPFMRGAVVLSMTALIFCWLGGIVHSEVIVNPNGSFENSTVTVGTDTGSVEGWTFNKGGSAVTSFAIVDEPVKDGTRALAVTVDAIGESPWHVEALNAMVPVVPGESYRYSVWAMANDTSATAHFTVGNPSYQEFLRIQETSTLGPEWKLITGEFTVPAADPDQARAPIHFSFEENIGITIYIDSLTITQITGLGGGDEGAPPIIVEAESGLLGDELETQEDEDVILVTALTDYNETTGDGSFPGTGRTVDYEVVFPDTGTYDLFARIYIGSGGFNDDSFFYGRGFGGKDASVATEWIIANGMAAAGFNDPAAVVRDPGALGNGVWKWVNLSRNVYQGGESMAFTVDSEEALTQTFSFGARENGLMVDKFAFGLSKLYFTVENLDSVQNGSVTDPRFVPEELEPIAMGKDKFLGCAYSQLQSVRFEEYWNQVTPENGGKWGSVERTRDVMSWDQMDEAYQFAKDNGFPTRFHVLVWGNQQPAWIEDLPTEEQREEIEEWFEAVNERYPDLDYVEVVNEPLHDPPNTPGEGGGNYIEALGGSGETGWDWVITAFELARQYLPNAKLYLNEYGIEMNTSAAADYVEIINLLNDRGLIDGVGVQAHAFSTRSAESLLKRCLDIIAKPGLPIQVMEMDVDGPTDDVQLADYQRLFPIMWTHPAVEGVTLWGWKPGLWRNNEQAYLMDNAGEERPALEWLRAYVDTANTEVSAVQVASKRIPAEFSLSNNYPNPFNPTTQIVFDVPFTSHVSLDVFDIRGRHVETLVDDVKQSGTYVATFHAGNLPSGPYIYRFKAGKYTQVKQMLFVK